MNIEGAVLLEGDCLELLRTLPDKFPGPGTIDD